MSNGAKARPSTLDEALSTGRIIGRAEYILSKLQEVVHDLEDLVSSSQLPQEGRHDG